MKYIASLLLIFNSLFSQNLSPLKEIASKDTTIHDVQYVDVSILNHVDSLSYTWFPYREKLKISFRESTIYSVPENPFILINGDVVQLKSPVKFYPNNIFFPKEEFISILNEKFDSILPYRDGKIYVHDSSKPASGLDVSIRKNGVMVDIQLPQQHAFSHFFHKPHFIIRFDSLSLDSDFVSSFTPNKWIKKVSVLNEKSTAQLTFEVSHHVGKTEVLKKDNNRVTLLFRNKNKGKTNKPKTVKKKKKIHNIIIDPGHGGKDPGAMGLRTNEKTITLSVAKALAKSLKKKGLNPILTRSKDKYLTLKERPDFASKNGGDLFISLHANAIDGNRKKKSRVRGFKIYILREAKSSEDKAIARRENAAIHELEGDDKNKAEISPVEWILLEHQLNLYTKESERFAGHIVENYSDHTSIRKHGHGAGQAGFYVLVGAFMPAVLVELGFISNPKEEKFMMSRKGQKEIVAALTEAVMTYKKEIEKN